jgi:hypothetical protein
LIIENQLPRRIFGLKDGGTAGDWENCFIIENVQEKTIWKA